MPKMPSTRFPFISLSKALERAEKIYNADRGGKGLSLAVAFSAWGYSDKSSGGFQTVGALRGYGILSAEGGQGGKTVALTDKARRYFQSEIEDDRQRLRADFARTPPLFAHLLDHWDYGTVEDHVARTHLKTEIGLNDQSARAALGIYKDNLSFAGSKGSPKIDEEPPANGAGGVADDAVQQRQQQQPSGQQGQRLGQTALALPVGTGPGLNVARTAEGYVVHLAGSVMTQAHAEEVVTLLNALRPMLPEGEKDEQAKPEKQQ